jgi:hypothetical protein
VQAWVLGVIFFLVGLAIIGYGFSRPFDFLTPTIGIFVSLVYGYLQQSLGNGYTDIEVTERMDATSQQKNGLQSPFLSNPNSSAE